jgi:ribonuclease BN (tRNA processing enzyme)
VEALLMGSGGFIPTDTRETTCVVIRDGDDALLLDAGSGLRRLTTGTVLCGVRRIDIVLTHFHLDHVVGLGYAPALPVAATVWAPGSWLYGRSSESVLAPLRTPPLSAFAPDELGEVRELAEGAQQIGAFTITTRKQAKHSAPTAGLRVGDALALVTDTAYDDGSIAFAESVSHLLHEAWSTEAEPVATDTHTTGVQAGRIATAAGARRLTLVHISPRIADEAALVADARRTMPDAEIGRDGVRLELG